MPRRARSSPGERGWPMGRDDLRSAGPGGRGRSGVGMCPHQCAVCGRLLPSAEGRPGRRVPRRLQGSFGRGAPMGSGSAAAGGGVPAAGQDRGDHPQDHRAPRGNRSALRASGRPRPEAVPAPAAFAIPVVVVVPRLPSQGCLPAAACAFCGAWSAERRTASRSPSEGTTFVQSLPGPHAKWGGCDVIGLYRRSTLVNVGQCPPETQSDQRKERPYRRCPGSTWSEVPVPREMGHVEHEEPEKQGT